MITPPFWILLMFKINSGHNNNKKYKKSKVFSHPLEKFA